MAVSLPQRQGNGHLPIGGLEAGVVGQIAPGGLHVLEHGPEGEHSGDIEQHVGEPHHPDVVLPDEAGERHHLDHGLPLANPADRHRGALAELRHPFPQGGDDAGSAPIQRESANPLHHRS